MPAATGPGRAELLIRPGRGGGGYYPYRHTGATAWYLLTAARVNPLRA
ncbi:hypothetical protein RKD18_000971 [Streptomyces phaeoluteigriseus]